MRTPTLLQRRRLLPNVICSSAITLVRFIPQPPLLGAGWATPLLQEAALKSRESAGLWSRPTPLENTGTDRSASAGLGALVWAMTPLSWQLMVAVHETGRACAWIRGHDPQLHVVSWADADACDPGGPIHLSRSVVTP